MKQTVITKTREWWKHLLLLCVTLLGVVGFATAGNPNYPFPQNYKYPNGTIYTGSDVQSKIQGLYTSWKSKYYVESGDLARVKFVQEGENGTNSVSEGIAYGMLITVFMDNATNNTQPMFDKLWAYYKKNMNEHGVMNWKVNAFTGQVTAGDGNANGATDADLDAAQSLLLAYKQWGDNKYLTAAQTLIGNIWSYEVDPSNKHLKPGDAFNDYENPCYFITNAMQLFDYVKGVQGWNNNWDWPAVINSCYTVMEKSANASTGLIPDWCYHDGSYLNGLIYGKFESIFGYDASRIPWRLAHAYAWYGHPRAQAMASKITTWAQKTHSNPGDIKDGYYLDGRPGDGSGPFKGSLSSWGTSRNATFMAGLSIGSMVDTKFNNYRDQCWQVGAASDPYGAYYTHTTQLLYMLMLTGNMPNFWDMNPVALSAETSSDGSAIYVDFSKPMSSSAVSASKGSFTIKTYADESLTNPTTITVSSASVSSTDSKRVVLNLSSDITDPYIYLSYNGTTLKATDNSVADEFDDMKVKMLITSMEPYPTARYTNVLGTEVYVQWSKEFSMTKVKAADFTVEVNGVAVSEDSIAYYQDEEGQDKTILALKWNESILAGASDVVTISYVGGTITSMGGTKTAKAFTNSPVQNFFMSVSCLALFDETTAYDKFECNATNIPGLQEQSGTTGAKALYLKAKAWDRLIYKLDNNAGDQTEWNTYTKTAGVRLKGRIYVKSCANDGLGVWFVVDGVNPGYDDNNAFIDLTAYSTVGQWNEFDLILSENCPLTWQGYNTARNYSSMYFGTYNAAKTCEGGGAFEIYVDHLEICPPDPVVKPTSGKVSYDGLQVELKFTTAMKIPTSTTAIKIQEGSTVHAVTAIETKAGDASTLIFTLADAITDDEAVVSASLTAQTADVKSADGRKSETFNLTLSNLVGMTTSTGWYDTFEDALDYTTGNLSGDGKKNVEVQKEDVANSVLNVAFNGAETWAGVLNLSTLGAGYVMDLTNDDKIELKFKGSKAASKAYYRIDVKDFFGNQSDGSWTEFSIGTSFQTLTYTSVNWEAIDKTSVAEVMIRFATSTGNAKNEYTPTIYDGTIYFDYISVGKALYLYDVNPAAATKDPKDGVGNGLDENATFTVKSSSDGYIFVVRGDVNPQYSAMAAAAVTGEGYQVACTANTVATVDMTGLGYGYFKAYAYDPETGSVSSGVSIFVKDVTPPVFTDYYSTKTVPLDGELYFTVDEDATVYIVPEGTDVTDFSEIASSVRHTVPVNGGELKTVPVSEIYQVKAGDKFLLVAVDGSQNISTAVPRTAIEVAQPVLTFTIEGTDYTVGDDISVICSRPDVDVYLVLADQSVRYKTIDSKATLKQTANTNGLAKFSTSDLTITEATDYLVYVKDAELEKLVGPSSILTVTPGNYSLNDIALDLNSVSVTNCSEGSKTVEVTFDEARYPDQRLTFSGADDYIDITYDPANNSAGTGNIIITGKNATPSPVTLTVSATADPTISKTITVVVTGVPNSVTIDGEATMTPGGTQTLTATVGPEGLASTQTGVTWSSSNTSVATVSTVGIVTAKGVGSTIITARTKVNGCDGDKVDESFVLSVEDAAFSGLYMYDAEEYVITEDGAVSVKGYVLDVVANPRWAELIEEEGEIDLKLVPVPEDAEIDLEVTSSDESVMVADVDAGRNGWKLSLTPGSSKGTANITVTDTESGWSGTFQVVTGAAACTTPAPTAAEVPSKTVCEGGAATLTATFASSTAKAVWYSAAEGGTALFTGNSYATGETAVGTYTYYVAKNDGCESVARTKVTLTITAKPTATLASTIGSSYCATVESVALSATPATGTWSGTGVKNATFSPKTAGAGTHTVTYTIGETGCQNQYTKDIVVTAAPAVTITVNEKMCSNDAAQTLKATPATGTWSGKGVTGTSFNPASGSSVVTYTYTDGPCEVVETAEITVTDNPTPIISGLDAAYCASASPVTMTAAPAKGTWSGAATSDTFDPATATVGENTITYTVEVNGCEGSTTKTVTVNAVPTIDLSAVPTTACANEEVALAPAKGTWTGTGVTGTTFKSATAGSYELTYTETANGCSASDAVTVSVNKPSVPTAAPVTVALGDPVPALSATGDGTIKWYETENGASVASGATYTPASVSTAAEKTYTFYVSNMVGTCESEKVPVVLSVSGCTVTAPTVAAVDAICEGDDFPTLTATATEAGVTVNWYDVVVDGTPLTTGTTFTPTAAGTYYVAQQSAECEGPRASVVVEVKAKPAAPTATGASSCAGAALVAMTTVETANWYADKTAAAVATNSKSYTPASLDATTTFYVNQTVNGCASDFAEVVYTVKEAPAAPAVEATSACIGDDAKYVVKATANAGAALQWYDANGAPAGTTATQTVSGVTTAKAYNYTVTQTVDGCTSAAETATLTVRELPTPKITMDAELCSNSETDVTLTAEPAGGSFTVDGVAKTSFKPSSLAETTHKVVYTYTDEYSCVKTATATFAVIDCSDPAVSSMTMNSTSESLTVGETATLMVTILPTEGTYNKAVQWISSDESVVTVDQTGKVTAVGAGTATVTVSSTYTEGKSATCSFTVVEAQMPVESVTFGAGVPEEINAGDTFDFSTLVKVNPADATAPNYVWSVSPSSAGSIDDNGLFTAANVTKNIGVTVTVRVTAGGVTKKASADFMVLKGAIPVTSITVDVPGTKQEENAEFTAYAIVEPANADVQDVTWSVSNANATIDQNGNVTVTGASGNTFDVIATAKDGSGVVGKATITIIDEVIPVQTVTIAAGTYTVTESGELDMSEFLTFSPADATITKITWSTVGGYVDIDSRTGVVRGKATSSKRDVKVQVIVESADGTQKSASATVTLMKDPRYVTAIEIPATLSLEEGATYEFEAELTPSNADVRTVTWSIKSGSGGTIDEETGELTITGSEGDQFVVVATSNDIMAVESNGCTVKVLKKTIPVTKIETSISSVNVTAGGESATITVSYKPENTTQVDFTLIPSSNIFSCVDNGDGTITVVGNQGGNASLTIKSSANSSVMKTIDIVVKELVKNITVSGMTTMNVGGTAQLSAKVEESTATDKTVTWSSNDENVAIVSATGLVTAKSAGLVQITATANDGSGVSGSTFISVAAIPVQSITVKNAKLEVEIGKTATIVATVNPSNATYKNLTYSVSDESVITVDANGVITTLAEGDAVVTITAPNDNVSTTMVVTVTPVKADKGYLYRLMYNEVWGAYAVYDKVQAGEIVVGLSKGQINPMVYNEFKNAWMNGQDVYDEPFASQEEVDAAARRLYNAIVAMGEKPVEVLPEPNAIDDVVVVNAKVYPTMVTNYVTVEAENLKSVKIVSATGKVVAYEQAIGDEIEIDATMFAQGVYKVIVETENGTAVRGFIK